ncbi:MULTISPECIES: MerR family transcriptional regulator [Nonlabens]|uniref:Transcriptional regulator n=1 Tax=Nonlabens agnitus TaxID=870484 RepID=A0A2S9WR61_9FLAO|nr:MULTISPECIES: MerR family transcriptional regulator [Nonlabens]KQC33104.1 transcriptional regulator [Nonlabens sp. YIK11]PRP65977.1 transcriptional regulator [Nonlabens agnitus]
MHVDLPEKLYYTMGEVTKAFDVNPSLIRFWEKEFDILQPKKNARGNRKFSQADVKNLQTIYHLVKERGFTLEGARDYMKTHKEDLSHLEIIKKLEFVKAELLKIKNSL